MRYFLFCLLCLVVSAAACVSDFDCAQCHSCKAHICTPVPAYTDPNDECPIRCDIKTVCGPTHICVFKQRPSCVCDWLEGTCRADAEETPPVPSIEEMQRQGLSDSEIKEILYFLKEDRQNPHRGHYHILPEDHAAAHDFIMLGNVVLVLLSLAVSLCAMSCMYRIKNAQKLNNEIKKR